MGRGRSARKPERCRESQPGRPRLPKATRGNSRRRDSRSDRGSATCQPHRRAPPRDPPPYNRLLRAIFSSRVVACAAAAAERVAYIRHARSRVLALRRVRADGPALTPPTEPAQRGESASGRFTSVAPTRSRRHHNCQAPQSSRRQSVRRISMTKTLYSESAPTAESVRADSADPSPANSGLPNRLLTAFEVAEFVGCHEETVRRAYLRGLLVSQRFGVRGRRFHPRDVADWIARGAPTRVS
jgi:hypothetical protein